MLQHKLDYYIVSTFLSIDRLVATLVILVILVIVLFLVIHVLFLVIHVELVIFVILVI